MWFIRLTLIAMLILLAILILFIWGPSSHPGNAGIEIETNIRMTAKNAHEIAKPVALQWAEDAQLIRLSANWDGGQKFQSGEGDWLFLYYSPAMASSATIAIHSGRARMVDSHKAPQPIARQHGESWRIDSEMAVDLVKAAGGEEFLRGQPDATVSMSLDFALDDSWRVRFIDQKSRRIFSAEVNMTDGEITQVQQS